MALLLTWINFNPHSPCGERLALAAERWTVERFQSTLPLRGATLLRLVLLNATLAISIHTPLAGSDFTHCAQSAHFKVFQSTLPLRGATERLT